MGILLQRKARFLLQRKARILLQRKARLLLQRKARILLQRKARILLPRKTRILLQQPKPRILLQPRLVMATLLLGLFFVWGRIGHWPPSRTHATFFASSKPSLTWATSRTIQVGSPM